MSMLPFILTVVMIKVIIRLSEWRGYCEIAAVTPWRIPAELTKSKTNLPLASDGSLLWYRPP